MFFQTISIVSAMGLLRGGGDGKFVLISEMILVWGFAVPLGVLGAFYWNLPIFWVFILISYVPAARAPPVLKVLPLILKLALSVLPEPETKE